MQARSTVTEVLRVVARQHTRMRGLVCEVALTSGEERTAAASWLSHYVVLHAAAEGLGLRRESARTVPSGVAAVVPPGVAAVVPVAVAAVVPGVTTSVVHPMADPHHGSLVRLALSLAMSRALDESSIGHQAALLEAAVVRHAQTQERVILPRLLASWPASDLERAVAALEAADVAFDHGPSEPIGAVATPDAIWRTAVTTIEPLLTSPSGDEGQAPGFRVAMTTATTVATSPTASVTPAVRTT